MAHDSKVVDGIRKLINTCRDSEKGYREAGFDTKSADLKSRLMQISAERGAFADQLEPELALLGENIHLAKDEGYSSGVLHRAWIDVKAEFGAGDSAVLRWLEQEDDRAKRAYEEVLKEALPPSIGSIVQQQYQSISRDHEQIKSMREPHKAA